MSDLGRVRAAADDFWRRAGIQEDFPRRLLKPVLYALPVRVVYLPRLQLARVENWLRRRASNFQFPCADRRVRGCLVALRGEGIIFVDSEDQADEQRVTLAHEAAHFLEDYLKPREAALCRLGEDIRPVLDGDRPPTLHEQFHAILAHVPLASHYNLIERGAQGELTLSEVWQAENRADQLALELLAPADMVQAQVKLDLPFYAQRRQALGQALADYGLPPDMARLYAIRLLHMLGHGPSIVERLRRPLH